MIGTLFLPISDKPYLIDIMMHNLIQIPIMENRLKCLIYDVSGNEEINNKLRDLSKKLKNKFIEVEHVIKPRKISEHVAGLSCSRANSHILVEKNNAIYETFQEAIPHMIGDFVIIKEDDILISPYVMVIDRLLFTMNIIDVGGVTAECYLKDIDNPFGKNRLASFDYIDERNIIVNPVKGKEEGITYIDACTTGLFVICKKYLTGYNLDDIFTNDLALCKNIKNNGKDIIVVHNSPTVHINYINGELLYFNNEGYAKELTWKIKAEQ